MSKTFRWTLLGLAAIGVLAGAVVAATAGSTTDITYVGSTVHSKRPITLNVLDGQSVTLSEQFAPLYCQGTGVTPGLRQITKPAAISDGGNFKASIFYEFIAYHEITTRMYVTGRISGKLATGTVRAEYVFAEECNGTTTFSARAQG